MTDRRSTGTGRGIALAVVLALAAGFLPAGASGQDADTGVRAGERIAFHVCAACHIVSPTQPDPPQLRPPARNFARIANRRGETADSLLGFLHSTHRTVKNSDMMPNPLLTDEEDVAVVHYILSLRKR